MATAAPSDPAQASPAQASTVQTNTDEPVVRNILWMNGGLGCDGDSVALTAATQGQASERDRARLPDCPDYPMSRCTRPLIDFECGPETGRRCNFIEWWHKADRRRSRAVRAGGGRLDPANEATWSGSATGAASAITTSATGHAEMTTSEVAGPKLAPKATGDPGRPATCATATAVSTRWRATRPARSG